MSKTARVSLRLAGIAILGSIAAYLNVNGHSAFWLWFGVFILFLALVWCVYIVFSSIR